jgi:PAS domain S-box-containing protein
MKPIDLKESLEQKVHRLEAELSACKSKLAGYELSEIYNQKNNSSLPADIFGLSGGIFRAIVTHAPIGIILANPRAELVLVNQAFCLMLGYSDAELALHTCPSITYPLDLEKEKPLLAALKQREINTYQLNKRFVKSDGSLLDAELTTAAIRDEQGNLLYILGMVIDITQRKRNESEIHLVNHQLSVQMIELQRLDNLKNDFMSTVSHELRTPLANMNLAISLLKDSLTNPIKSTAYLDILESECRREVELINDLLDLQHRETVKKHFYLELIDLLDWLPSILHPFEERLRHRNQTLSLNHSPNLDPIEADRISLERILTELLNNACKYSTAGSSIEVRLVQTPNQLIVSVLNNGPVIPAIELPRIFDKFYRIPKGDPWNQGGTGLGLALVKSLIEQMNGSIKVSSEEGATCFTVILPQN